MTKFDKNYLGHNFIAIHKEDICNYRCSICMISIIYFSEKAYKTFNYYEFIHLNFTCNEYIIKNIIE